METQALKRGRPRKYPLVIIDNSIDKRGRGRPKGSFARHTRKNIETRSAFSKLVEQNIQPLFDALYEKAVSGDVIAIKEMFDRAWGRSTQTIDLNQNIKLDLVNLANTAAKLLPSTAAAFAAHNSAPVIEAVVRNVVDEEEKDATSTS